MDSAVKSFVEGRAEEVADWLRRAFEVHDTWLAIELNMAAESDGIWLPTWIWHPVVQREIHPVNFFGGDGLGGFGIDGLVLYRKPELESTVDLRGVADDQRVS